MRLLIADEDIDFINNIKKDFEKEYIIDYSCSGDEAVVLSSSTDYDAILISGLLSDLSGLDCCRYIRDSAVKSPIVYVSNIGDGKEKVESLKSGADAYISKPVNYEEICAEIEALRRRRYDYNLKEIYKFGTLDVDITRKTITHKNKIVILGRKEFEILEFLILNKGRIVSKEILLDNVWSEGIYVESNILEVTIHKIRKKLEKPFNQKIIKTVRDYGYGIF